VLIAHTYAYANCYSESYGDGDSHTNNNPDTYAKAFTHPSASSDAATSPIAGKQVVTNVKWLGAREKISRVSQLTR
jgi:hypothetical protein